jgi:hypothetical protein
MMKRDDLDIRIIGSDVSIKAIETATNNIDFSEMDKIVPELIIPRKHKIINNPLIYS